MHARPKTQMNGQRNGSSRANENRIGSSLVAGQQIQPQTLDGLSNPKHSSSFQQIKSNNELSPTSLAKYNA